MVRSALDLDPARLVGLGAGRGGDLARERRRLHAGRPQDRARRESLRRPARGRLDDDLVLGDVGDPGRGANRHAELLQLAPRRRRSAGRIARQDPVHRLDEDDPGVGWVDRPEVAPERVVRDLAERAWQLHAGRPAADDDERHPLAAALGDVLALRRLEGDEDPAADLEGVVDRLEALREPRPLVVPEVRVPGPGRDHERVVRDRAAVGQLDLAPLDVDPGRLAEEHRRVPVATNDAPQRLGDLAGRERAGCDLVEQRLEDVMVAAIDERQVDPGVAAEPPGCVQPPESAADDGDAVPGAVCIRP